VTETEFSGNAPTGEIKGLAVLDLSTLTGPEDLAGISSITGVAQILVPESLVPALNAIPQSGVASVVSVKSPAPLCARTRYAWSPFGGGAHKCIGMYFAGMQVKTILHQVLQRYRWSVPADYEWPLDTTSLPSPKDGLPVRLERLEQS
jgi:hypothetical protein